MNRIRNTSTGEDDLLSRPLQKCFQKNSTKKERKKSFTSVSESSRLLLQRIFNWSSNKIYVSWQIIHIWKCNDQNLEKCEILHVFLRIFNNSCWRCAPRWGIVLDQRPSVLALLSKKSNRYRSPFTEIPLLVTLVKTGMRHKARFCRFHWSRYYTRLQNSSNRKYFFSRRKLNLELYAQACGKP